MTPDARILDDYVEEAEFARANNISTRTSARYRNQPNGLPYLEWGGKIYIHLKGAREVVRARTKRRNPTRALQAPRKRRSL